MDDRRVSPRRRRRLLGSSDLKDDLQVQRTGWNVLAWAFERVLAGKMDAAQLDYVHSMTLDTRGPGFLPEGKPAVHLK
jgi:hypothetical protein